MDGEIEKEGGGRERGLHVYRRGGGDSSTPHVAGYKSTVPNKL